MDQFAIIQSAQQGDLDAFNQLVLAYQDRLFSIAAYMLESEDCAADAVQNAFVLAFRHISDFRGGSFEFWLVRILKNVCYNELRHRKRHPTYPLEPLAEDKKEIDFPVWLTDHARGPEDQAELDELAQTIRAGLQRLTPNFRTVIVLIDVLELDYAEAAIIVGVPVGTIKSRLARARLGLRRELQRHGDFLPDVYTAAKTPQVPNLMILG